MDAFLAPAFLPFSIALGLLFGLMLLEILAALVGGTLLGLGGEAEFDLDIDTGLEGADGFDLADADMLEVGEAPNLDAATGPGDWLGLSKAPTMVWVAALLLGFGLTGLIVQTITGSIIPSGITAIAAALAGVGFARQFAGVFARLIPKSESTALSERSLGRRKGVVSQGTAARGKPAEVRVVDGHGNMHHLRAEPLRDDVAIPPGTEVLVMRQPGGHGYRLIPLSDL